MLSAVPISAAVWVLPADQMAEGILEQPSATLLPCLLVFLPAEAAYLTLMGVSFWGIRSVLCFLKKSIVAKYLLNK